MNNRSSLVDETEIQSISFWQAFKFWLKLGFISFGACWANRGYASGAG